MGAREATLPRAPARSAADLWWLHPARIMLLALLPIYLSYLLFDFARVVKNVYIPGWGYAWGVVLLLSVAVGSVWALSGARRGTVRAAPPQVSRGVMLVLLGLSSAAYAIWLGPLLGKPQVLMDLILGRRSEVRDVVSTVSGVTTLTQLGVAYMIAYAIKTGAGVQKVSRIEHAGFVALIVLAVFRAFVWAERLAVIEMLVCFLIARMAFVTVASPQRWRLASIIPIAAPPVLYLLFTAGEYFRAWPYYVNQYSSVWAFTIDRLMTYYATAANNGIGMLADITAWPYYTGVFAMEWAYIMPGVGPLLESAFGSARGVDDIWLNSFARIEFNSSTAYFRVVLDLGYFGSALYFLAIGYLIGRAYAGYRVGRLFGLLTFPVFVLFLIESLRYNYLTEPRIVPLGLGLAIVALDVRRLRHRSTGTGAQRYGALPT